MANEWKDVPTKTGWKDVDKGGWVDVKDTGWKDVPKSLPFFLEPFKLSKEEVFGKRYIPGITEGRPMAVAGAKGLEVLQRTYGGLTRAIAEPEKEITKPEEIGLEETPSVRQMVGRAFRRGFEKPEEAMGLFGGEITEFGLERGLPPAAAIALGTVGGTAADVGLAILAEKTIKAGIETTSLGAKLLGKTVKRGVEIFGKPPISEEISIAPPSVQKITQALKEAKPIRELQEKLYTIERSERAAELVKKGKIGGEKGFFAQLKALKGQLLDEESIQKVQFEGIRNKLSQTDIDDLFNIIEKSEDLMPFEKISAKTGLAKLLGSEGGGVPPRSQLQLLSNVFPEEFINEVLRKAPLLQKISTIGYEVANIPRAIMASFDLSMPFRQGIFLIRRQKQFAPAFRDMFKYFSNEKSYQGLMDDIQKRPNYNLMRDSKLQITQMGGSLAKREELFMGGKYAERIPIIGKVVRMSNRAAIGFLNKLRADVFDDLVNRANRLGLDINTEALSIAKYVNHATGRGSLGNLERAAVAVNTVFFSPRLMASRLNLLNPVFYYKLSPFVRKEALKDLFGFAATATTIFGLAKMGGADIGADPRNADFGKIKVGNTRYDILGGFQQYVRLAAQWISGEHISSTTGVKTTVGEGYKPLTRAEILERFIETKEAPVLSFATTLLKGKGFAGRELTIPKEVSLRFIPMVIQDMYDLWMEKGLVGTFMATPAFFGIGVQTYSPNAQEVVRARNSVIIHAKELISRGREDEAQKLLDKNKALLQQGTILSPFQKVISSLEQNKKKIEENIMIPKTEKKMIINRAIQIIKKQKKDLEDRFKLVKERQESQYEWRDIK